MKNFHGNIDIYIGSFLVLCSLALVFIPPKFGNDYYGICTKWTMKNETAWAAGQKLFALAIFVIGIIVGVLGSLKIHKQIPHFAMFALIIVLWNISKYLVHKKLAKKYANF